MAVPGAALLEILDRTLEGRGAGGIAVVTGDGARVDAVWRPGSSRDEPGYLAYSITKTFTATVVLQLRDAQRLSLDDPLARWFPGIDRSERISLRQLLDHTAGIPDYGALASYHDAVRASPSVPWSFERFAAETFEKGLRFEPGSSWAYSNPGYMLLKRISEELTGRSYGALIRDRITRPLGLARTFVPETLDDLASLASAESTALSIDRTAREVRGLYHPGWVSHGVVASTPSEIARFLDALFRHDLLAARSRREMTTLVSIGADVPAGASRWRKPGYGLGIMGDPESSWGRLWGHSGGGPGYSTSVLHAPDAGEATVCAMCSVEGDARAEAIVFTVLDAMRQAS
jgi:D-alanyl-D-alanine carboxypeptidase